MSWFLRIVVVACAVFLAGCSGEKDHAQVSEEILADVPDTDPVETLYNDAMNKLQQEDWRGAKKAFEEVEKQHPYSQWAKRAQILNAYANYENQNYEETVAIVSRFARLYPGDERIPYAFYLKALSYYEQISDVGRDQAMTRRALEALQDVMRRFPNSDYARDAQVKRDLTIDHLAGKEMKIGRYYLNKKEYLAAIKRFERVLEEYQTTTHAPEVLHRLVEAYLKLGVVAEARKYGAVLGHNFPKSEWYKDSFALLDDGKMVPPQDSDAGTEQGNDEDGWFDSIF